MSNKLNTIFGLVKTGFREARHGLADHQVGGDLTGSNVYFAWGLCADPEWEPPKFVGEPVQEPVPVVVLFQSGKGFEVVETCIPDPDWDLDNFVAGVIGHYN